MIEGRILTKGKPFPGGWGRVIARWVARLSFHHGWLDQSFSSLTRLFTYGLNRGSFSWCEVWYTVGDCSFPYGQGKCPVCPEDRPCPPGYQPSFAYGYPSTGCWCVAKKEGITKICCDCTPLWNDPHQRHPLDCQCSQTIQHGVGE